MANHHWVVSRDVSPFLSLTHLLHSSPPLCFVLPIPFLCFYHFRRSFLTFQFSISPFRSSHYPLFLTITLLHSFPYCFSPLFPSVLPLPSFILPLAVSLHSSCQSSYYPPSFFPLLLLSTLPISPPTTLLHSSP